MTIGKADFTPLKEEITKVAQSVKDVMAAYLPFNPTEDQPLFNAMAYSSLTGGKRLRSYILWLVARNYNVPYDQAMQAAAAVEFVHCASLIHDDLPCMDNADTRRGAPSCHKQFREDIALLAGDSLFILPYEILQDPKTHPDPKVRLQLISLLAQTSGMKGIMLGQAHDVLGVPESNPTLDQIVKLAELKTGNLFAYCCAAGGLLGGACEADQKKLYDLGLKMGVLYQLVDDILDVESNEVDLGKPTSQDAENNKSTFVNVLGHTQVGAFKNQVISDTYALAKSLAFSDPTFENFIEFLESRKK